MYTPDYLKRLCGHDQRVLSNCLPRVPAKKENKYPLPHTVAMYRSVRTSTSACASASGCTCVYLACTQSGQTATCSRHLPSTAPTLLQDAAHDLGIDKLNLHALPAANCTPLSQRTWRRLNTVNPDLLAILTQAHVGLRILTCT
jgi:hypothetical protein